MMATARLRLGLFLALAGTTLSACDETTGPSGPFDPELSAEAVADMVAASEQADPAFASIALAGALFEEQAASAAYLVPTALADADGALAYAEGLTTLAAPYFPADYLGRTFVWDNGQQRYVPEGNDGPADGIRVIYYAINPVTRRPTSQRIRLGYIDLRDLSSASSERLGVRVVSEEGETEVTLADYYVDASAATTSGRVRSEGYLSDGTHQLNFNLSNQVSFSQEELTLVQDFRMWLDEPAVSVRYEGSISFGNEATVISMKTTVEGDGHYLVFEISTDGELVEGEVRHGSDVLAVIGGTPEEPTFSDASTGEPLTQGQLEALGELFRSVQGLFELAGGIFGEA